MELLRFPDIQCRVQKCYMLFPTMERMATTPSGRFIDRIMLRMFCLLKIVHILLHALPECLQRRIISIYFYFCGIPKFFLDAALIYVRPTVAEKIVFMAKEEMEMVKELDIENIEKHKHLLKLYYGTTDGWVPTSFYYELMEKVPDLDAELDTHKIAHAFVLKSSRQMGRMVGDWINRYKEF